VKAGDCVSPDVRPGAGNLKKNCNQEKKYRDNEFLVLLRKLIVGDTWT